MESGAKRETKQTNGLSTVAIRDGIGDGRERGLEGEYNVSGEARMKRTYEWRPDKEEKVVSSEIYHPWKTVAAFRVFSVSIIIMEGQLKVQISGEGFTVTGEFKEGTVWVFRERPE